MDPQVSEIEEVIRPAVQKETARSAVASIGEDQLGSMTKREHFIPAGLTSLPRNYDEVGPVDTEAGSHNDAAACCLARVRSRLGEMERPIEAQASSYTIFKVPKVLHDIHPDAVAPKIVSIGPYHRGGKDLCEFEEHKWYFLKKFLDRTGSNEEDLIKLVANKESFARQCYSEAKNMPSSDFMEMMLLDGCFVVEILLHIFRSGHLNDEKDPIHTRPERIPVLIRDLLKLENQVPYSLLQSFFDLSSSTSIEAKTPYLCMLALRVFNWAYPGPMVIVDMYTDLQYRNYPKIKSQEHKHLLDLFHFSLSPKNSVQHNYEQQYRPSDQSIPCVTQLRSSGIKFKSKKTDSFLDISFQKRVLEIPSISIDDFTTTVLINCIALEQCRENSSKHVTDYVSFMHCLVNQPKDVSLLCSDGIISTLSWDDQNVVNLFDKLGKNLVFNVRDCYLSKQFEELESYYQSNWASMIRNYFSSPWSVISVFTGFLIVVLTMTQTIYAVFGQHLR